MAKDIQQINKGIVKDINQEFQPEATYRFMLNGMFESLTGERGGVVNERGNTIILSTPSGITNPHVIGNCLLPNQDKVLFITGNDGTNDVQIIGLHKENNTWKELIRTTCLDYTECDQVDCIFKVHNGCDNIIYFTDHANRYKCINITAVESQTGRYEKASHTAVGPVPTGDNSANYPDISGLYGWDCNSFYLSPTSSHPDIFFHNQTNSGSLRVGAYTFFVRLLDNDLNPTDWLTWTNPFYVKKGDFNFDKPEDNTDGYYIDVDVANFTSRSISLNIINLDTAFQYYEVGILERSLNTGLPSYAYRSGQRKIPGSGTDIFLFNSNTDSRFETYDLASLITKSRKIDVVQAHTQINNRLILGNVNSSQRDWAAFQKVSNEIQTEYFTYYNVRIDTDTCDFKYHAVCTGNVALDLIKTETYWNVSVPIGVNYSSPEFLSYGMSLMRDEIYALGIIYVFNDGSESPVFHIPGRPKFSSTVLDWTTHGDIAVDTYDIDGFDYSLFAHTQLQTLTDPNFDAKDGQVLQSIPFGTFDNQVLDIGPAGKGVDHNIFRTWESGRLTNLTQDNALLNVTTDEYKYLYGFSDFVTCCNNVRFASNSCGDNGLQRWQYYNTAIRRKGSQSWNQVDLRPTLSGDNPHYEFNGGFQGIPGYFDTGLEYPDILDCNGDRIYPEGYVRHHRMPDHRIEQIFDLRSPLGFSDITIQGATTPGTWTSNINTPNDTYTGDYWTMGHSEQSLQLYPLGLRFSNVAPPVAFRDDVVGYYIVRSDRANNKTVIDKGFMNVCDTSVTQAHWPGGPNAHGIQALDDFNALNENKIYANEFFLTPTWKSGIGANFAVEGEGFKYPQHTWWNIIEMHTPKSTFNEQLVLAADYVKLESTVFGDLFFDNLRKYVIDGNLTPADGYVIRKNGLGWNVGASAFLNRHKYPRVQSAEARYDWHFIYNIPLSGLSYVDYNSDKTTSLLGQASTTIVNGSYQQQTLLGRYGQSCTPIAPVVTDDPNSVLNIPGPATNYVSDSSWNSSRSNCVMSFPYYYDLIKNDIRTEDPTDSHYIPTSTIAVGDLNQLMWLAQNNTGYATPQTWARDQPLFTSDNIAEPHKWSVPHSPYMYYAALKSAIVPYEDFDSIKYIKMHSYLIPFDKDVHGDPQSFPVTGGDTFIQRFQFEKGYYNIDTTDIPAPPGDDNDKVKFCTSLTVGYVESEINSQFRHLLEGDEYISYPFDNRDTFYFWMDQVLTLFGGAAGDRGALDTYMATQEIFYRYKIDYSVVNADIPLFQLPSTFDFCSSCSESFPNTIFYSEISLDSQVQDFYKLFLTNSEKAIPSYTGSIQDLFVKNSDLYVHTENNLWKLSVAPQTMKTSTDTVEVGQGEFLERDPVKLFNNEDGFARGGIVDKFSSIYSSTGEYIWLDRTSRSIYSLLDQPRLISEVGLSRWFTNNIELNLDRQFKAFTSLSYPYKGTSCPLNVGYKAVLDPEHERYILTKRDYELTPSIISSMIELTTDITGATYVPATVIGQYYYDDDGFYVGIAVGTDVTLKDTLVSSIDYTDEDIAENKSWTISYGLKEKSWTSWHSYIPNWMYNDSTTFYSFIDNTTGSINLSIWEHNYGAFTTYYGTKFDFIIDYIYKKNPYQDKTFDSIEYTSNVWLEDISTDRWIEVPFTTFDRFFVYNNNQISNLKTVTVGNLTPYYNTNYDVTDASAHKTKNVWKINRLRDMAINRLTLTESLFSADWLEPTYQSQFDNGFGYIDRVINPSAISLTKPVYTIERLTDKYLGVRLFFNPEEDYKITFNLLSGEKRIKI